MEYGSVWVLSERFRAVANWARQYRRVTVLLRASLTRLAYENYEDVKIVSFKLGKVGFKFKRAFPLVFGAQKKKHGWDRVNPNSLLHPNEIIAAFKILTNHATKKKKKTATKSESGKMTDDDPDDDRYLTYQLAVAQT